MKILICNDDGIESFGLRAIAKKLAEKHQVFIVAPDGNRSACSHSLTVRDGIKVTKREDVAGCTAYAISGYPADCVKIARHLFSDFVPDVVVSGINKGHNLGSDILYSGTVAIAYEASFFGITSFAFSAFSHGESDFCAFSEIASKIMDKLYPVSKKGAIWNVNFPDNGIKILGTKITPLGANVYIDDYKPENEGVFRLYGEVERNTAFYDCDIEWIKRGYVTVTPLKYDKSDFETIKKFGIKGEQCITW